MLRAFRAFLWPYHAFEPLNGTRPCRRTALVAGLAIAFLAFASLIAAPVLAQPRSTQKSGPRVDSISESSLVQLVVTVDKARTVGCDQEFTEILVANPLIADVIALSNKQLYVLGKKAGITSISLVGTDKRILGLVNVEVAHDLDGLSRRLIAMRVAAGEGERSEQGRAARARLRQSRSCSPCHGPKVVQ